MIEKFNIINVLRIEPAKLCSGSFRRNTPGDDGLFVVFRFWPLFVLCSFLVFYSKSPVAGEVDTWSALNSANHFALIRHAVAPGTGDPAHFELDNCATQRNLSDEGRRQAIAIGDNFRANGLNSVSVYSSQWCRCLDTAELLSLGSVQELPVLNSFFRRNEREASQTKALTEWIAKQDGSAPIVLITHQVNITALTGVYPSSGEMVVVHQSDAGVISVIGRLQL